MEGFTEVIVWGDDKYGQLGLGPQHACRIHALPRFCSFNIVIKKVACGKEHTGIIAETGHVYTMGNNADGRLGLNDMNLSHAPSPSLVEGITNAQDIACGWAHTLVCTHTGHLFAWGLGEFGALGTGSTRSRWQPAQVKLPRSLNVTQVSAGMRHSGILCADSYQQGILMTCGSGDQGQLATGRRDREINFVQVDLPDTLQAVECGSQHTIFLTVHGQVLASGSNLSGQLGVRNLHSSHQAVPVTFLEGVEVQKIACKQFNVALSVRGEVYVWGQNDAYRVPVDTPVTDISIGNGFVLALDTSQSVYSWGQNTKGELGVGDFDNRSHPTLMTSLKGKRVTQVQAGSSFCMCLGPTVYSRSPQRRAHGSYDQSMYDRSPIDRSSIERSPIDRSYIEKSYIDKSYIDKSYIDRSPPVERTPLDRHSIERSPIDRKLQERNTPNRSSYEELDKLRQEQAELKTRLSMYATENQRMYEELQRPRLDSHLEQTMHELQRMEAKATEQLNRIEGLEAQLLEEKRRNNKLEQDLVHAHVQSSRDNQFKLENEQLRFELNENANKINTLDHETKRLQAALAEERNLKEQGQQQSLRSHRQLEEVQGLLEQTKLNVARLEQSLNEERRNTQRLDSQLAAATADAARTQQELEHSQHQSQDKAKSFERDLTELKQQVSALSSEKERLYTENLAMFDTNRTLQRNLEDTKLGLQQELTRLKDSHQSQVKVLDLRCAELQTALSNTQAEYDKVSEAKRNVEFQLERTQQTLSEELYTLRLAHDKTEQQCSVLQNQVTSTDLHRKTEAQEVSARLESYRRSLQETEESLVATQSKVQQLTSDLEREKYEKERLFTDHTSLRQSVQQTDNKLSVANSHIRSLSSQLESQKFETLQLHEHSKEEFRSLQEELDLLRTQNTRLQNELHEVQASKDAVTQDLSGQYNRTLHAHRDLREAYEQILAENRQLHADVSDLELKNRQLFGNLQRELAQRAKEYKERTMTMLNTPARASPYRSRTPVSPPGQAPRRSVDQPWH